MACRKAPKFTTLDLVTTAFFVVSSAATLAMQRLFWDDSRLKRYHSRSSSTYYFHWMHLCSHWHFYLSYHLVYHHSQYSHSFIISKELLVRPIRSTVYDCFCQPICLESTVFRSSSAMLKLWAFLDLWSAASQQMTSACLMVVSS